MRSVAAARLARHVEAGAAERRIAEQVQHRRDVHDRRIACRHAVAMALPLARIELRRRRRHHRQPHVVAQRAARLQPRARMLREVVGEARRQGRPARRRPRPDTEVAGRQLEAPARAPRRRGRPGRAGRRRSPRPGGRRAAARVLIVGVGLKKRPSPSSQFMGGSLARRSMLGAWPPPLTSTTPKRAGTTSVRRARRRVGLHRRVASAHPSSRGGRAGGQRRCVSVLGASALLVAVIAHAAPSRRASTTTCSSTCSGASSVPWRSTGRSRAQPGQAAEVGQQRGVGMAAEIGPRVGAAVHRVGAAGHAHLVAVEDRRRARVGHLEEHGQPQLLLGERDLSRRGSGRRRRRSTCSERGASCVDSRFISALKALRRVGLAHLLEVGRHQRARRRRSRSPAPRCGRCSSSSSRTRRRGRTWTRRTRSRRWSARRASSCLTTCAPLAPEVVGHPRRDVHAPARRPAPSQVRVTESGAP